jgi:phospholipid/cholesterol/gamma-HCH transport system substrate-binding protein
MRGNVIETVMGAVVLVVAAFFLFFAYTTAHIGGVSGYELTARFNRIEGLRDGGDVRISGIKVGSIVSQSLDPKDFVAIVKISVDPSIKLPVDTVATITSAGLFGDKYLALEPGNDDKTIPPGGQIDHTQSPMSLESLIGQYIFSQQQPAAKKPEEGGGAPQLPPASGELPPAK